MPNSSPMEIIYTDERKHLIANSYRINRHKFAALYDEFFQTPYIKTDLLIEMSTIINAIWLKDKEFLKGDIFIFESGTETSPERIQYRTDKYKQTPVKIIPIRSLLDFNPDDIS